jgi:hypothetical protein
MRLSSNIGFSYTGPYENLDTDRILFAPALSSFLLYKSLSLNPCLCGQVKFYAIWPGFRP